MTRELDRRDFDVNRATPDRRFALDEAAEESSSHLPGDQAVQVERLDPTTGNPATIAVTGGPSHQGDYVQRALDHVQSISPTMGFAAEQPTEYAADPHVQETSSGAATVHLQQHYKAIPIFDAAVAVRFEPDGALRETVGTMVTVAEDPSPMPRLAVEEAVARAARHVAEPDADEEGEVDEFGQPMPTPSVDISRFRPTVVAGFADRSDRPTVLKAGPFGDEIKANLVWFPLRGGLRLAWEVVTAMPDYRGMYRTLVDAGNGEILYCRQLVQAIAARGNVYHLNGAGERKMTTFPRPLADYDLPAPRPDRPLPNGFPDRWIARNRTIGNAVFARRGEAGPSIQGFRQDGVLTFDPLDPTGTDQQVLNIFYYNCVMHDYFYVLGFREADGNFQHDNFLRGGAQNDRVDARAHPGVVWGTANMLTRIDGQGAEMNMGLVERTGRHTAFDSDVVFHEFVHGVTNRLVGGRLNDTALRAPQSGGMGEGWGDYFACVINNTTVVGSWVVDKPGGLREFPYDSNFPDSFANLGTGRYTRVHAIGELWCATLMEMTRNIARHLAVQLVVDALKLAPANPSFLEMRDAILRALDDKHRAGHLDSGEHAVARGGIWRAFAKFGMGPGARSNGAQLSGIVADFTQPPEAAPGGGA